MRAHKPVLVGDTIWANVTVTGIKPTSKNNRAVINRSTAHGHEQLDRVLVALCFGANIAKLGLLILALSVEQV